MFGLRPVFALFLVTSLVLWAGSLSAQSDRRQVSDLLRRGQFDDALSHLEPLLEANPSDVALLTLRGMALLGLGRNDSAAASFNNALSQRPDYLPALQMLAQVEFAARAESASETLEKVLALRPDDTNAHAMLAELAAEEKDCTAAVMHFDKAHPVFDQNPSRLWPQAACLFETERYADAERAYRTILDASPENPVARFNLALAQFRGQAYDAAVQTLTPAASASVPESDVLSLLADAYEGANHIPEALKTLQRAVRLYPADEQLYLQLAELCVGQGSYDLAHEVLEAGIQTLRSSARLYAMRGVVYSQQGRFEQSEEAFEQSSRLNAGDEITAMGLTLTLEKGGRLDDAVAMLRQQLLKNPDQPNLSYMLAEALLKQGATPGQDTFQEALDALRASVEGDPKKVRPRVALGQLYLKTGDAAAAIEHLQQAVELDPSDSTAGYQLALAFLKEGRKEEAATLMEKVRRLVNEERRREITRSRHRLVRVESPGEQ